MNYRKIFHYLGIILLVEALLMILPVIIGLLYRERIVWCFLVTMALLGAVGFLFYRRKPSKNSLYSKEGYVIVALAWVLMSLFGALPFFICGNIPNYLDAFFETVSGFTTTGATILTEIETMPKCLLFWRSFTHFIGGMGILVFVIAIMPKTEGSSIHIMRAEVPGPTMGKLVSKLRMSARILYGIYCGMTALLFLLLFAGGMPAFDSITTAFATAGTGGFSVLNNSIEGYREMAGVNSNYIEVVLSFGMIFFGVNFNLYYLILMKHGKHAVKDEEMHWYAGIIAVAVILITAVLTVTKHPFGESLRLSLFQVASIISTTGFSSTDFDLWPSFTKIILVILMFIGSCAGSTGGGLKISRVAIMIKQSFRSVKKASNPRRVEMVKLNGRAVDEEIVHSTLSYFSMAMLLTALSIIIVSIDGFDLTSSTTSVIACFNNVGPGLSLVGPTGNYFDFSPLSKIVLCFDMLAGRLELLPMLLLFRSFGSNK